MPTFLSDPAPALYLILVGFVVVSGAIAARKQDRRSLAVFGVACALLLVVFLLDRTGESPREEAVRRVQELARAADTRNRDEFISHVADRVEFPNASPPVTKSREQIKNSPFWDLLRAHNVHVAVWDFSRDDVREIDANTVEVGFLGKGEAEGKQFPVYLRATFARQPDGKFRLTKIATFHPTNHAEPLAVPGFP